MPGWWPTRRCWRPRIPDSVGEAYNITSHCRITQREFLDMLADAIGAPRVTWHYPFWYAFYGGFSLEIRDRLLAQPEAAARHPLRCLAAGPVPGIQHGEGPPEAGLDARPDVSGEHRADGPLVPGRRARRGCPTTGCRPWSGSARDSRPLRTAAAAPGLPGRLRARPRRWPGRSQPRRNRPGSPGDRGDGAACSTTGKTQRKPT